MPLFSPRSRGQTPTEVRPRSTTSFSRKRDSNASVSSGSPARSRSVLSRFREMSSDSFANDTTIVAARQKLANAENAERDVDRALDVARQAVKEARHHVKSLEAAAIEEARRARVKQLEAKTIRKGADLLGRHDHT